MPIWLRHRRFSVVIVFRLGSRVSVCPCAGDQKCPPLEGIRVLSDRADLVEYPLLLVCLHEQGRMPRAHQLDESSSKALRATLPLCL